MDKNTTTRKKAYAPPRITRHGEVVEKTLGNTYWFSETWNQAGPPHEN